MHEYRLDEESQGAAGLQVPCLSLLVWDVDIVHLQPVNLWEVYNIVESLCIIEVVDSVRLSLKEFIQL